MSNQIVERNGIKFKFSTYFKSLEDYAKDVFANYHKAVKLNLPTMASQYKDVIDKLEKVGITETNLK